MTERQPARKGTQKSASAVAVNKTFDGFTGEERAAMMERAQERTTAARRGRARARRTGRATC
jgi:hypothetical protein